MNKVKFPIFTNRNNIFTKKLESNKKLDKFLNLLDD